MASSNIIKANFQTPRGDEEVQQLGKNNGSNTFKGHKKETTQLLSMFSDPSEDENGISEGSTNEENTCGDGTKAEDDDDSTDQEEKDQNDDVDVDENGLMCECCQKVVSPKLYFVHLAKRSTVLERKRAYLMENWEKSISPDALPLFKPPKTYDGCTDIAHEIIDNFIYQSGSKHAKSRKYLVENKISYVLDCSGGDLAQKETYVLYIDLNINSKHLKIPDTGSYNISKDFGLTNDFIAEAKKNNARILVHCHYGVSRSSAVIIAYLMKHLSMTFLEALKLVRQKREYAYPNPGFWKSLLQYDEEIHGVSSIPLDALILTGKDS